MPGSGGRPPHQNSMVLWPHDRTEAPFNHRISFPCARFHFLALLLRSPALGLPFLASEGGEPARAKKGQFLAPNPLKTLPRLQKCRAHEQTGGPALAAGLDEARDGRAPEACRKTFVTCDHLVRARRPARSGDGMAGSGPPASDEQEAPRQAPCAMTFTSTLPRVAWL